MSTFLNRIELRRDAPSVYAVGVYPKVSDRYSYRAILSVS